MAMTTRRKCAATIATKVPADSARLRHSYGTQVMQRHRCMATELASMKKIKMLLQDITAGRVSPLVSAGMKAYYRTEAAAATIASNIVGTKCSTAAIKKGKLTHSQTNTKVYDLVCPTNTTPTLCRYSTRCVKHRPYVCININVGGRW